MRYLDMLACIIKKNEPTYRAQLYFCAFLDDKDNCMTKPVEWTPISYTCNSSL